MNANMKLTLVKGWDAATEKWVTAGEWVGRPPAKEIDRIVGLALAVGLTRLRVIRMGEPIPF